MKKSMVWMAAMILAASAWRMQAQGAAQTAAPPQGEALPQPEQKQLTQEPTHDQGKLAGNWQGTLQVGQGSRVLIKMTNDGAQYRGVMYLIDGGGQAVGLTAITVNGTEVAFGLAAMRANFTGTLNPDGSSISGSVKRADGPTYALNLSHVSDENAWAIPEPPKPMAKDATPKFESVTVKPSRSESVV